MQIDSSYDHSSNSYAWEVRNLDESPIVAIEFPHYGADLFTVPDGWKTSTPEDMNLVRVGWDDSIGGILRADRGDDPLGIWRGRSARFGARAPVHRTTPGEGTVRVVFQDGSEALVPGVTVPTMVERGSPWLGLLGGGALFLAWVIVREIRRRKAGAGQATGELAEPARRPDAAAP